MLEQKKLFDKELWIKMSRAQQKIGDMDAQNHHLNLSLLAMLPRKDCGCSGDYCADDDNNGVIIIIIINISLERESGEGSHRQGERLKPEVTQKRFKG